MGFPDLSRLISSGECVSTTPCGIPSVAVASRLVADNEARLPLGSGKGNADCCPGRPKWGNKGAEATFRCGPGGLCRGELAKLSIPGKGIPKYPLDPDLVSSIALSGDEPLLASSPVDAELGARLDSRRVTCIDTGVGIADVEGERTSGASLVGCPNRP